MNKELFVNAINSLENQDKHDNNYVDSLSKVLPNAFEGNLYYDNHYVKNAIIIILQELTGDISNCECGMSWIEYFLYELDFGKKYKKGCVTENGKNIDLSDAGKLYDFLMLNKNKLN